MMIRPIISIKSDYSPLEIVTNIINGEYTRNGNLDIVNVINAKEYAMNILDSRYVSPDELPDLIDKAMEILYFGGRQSGESKKCKSQRAKATELGTTAI